MFMVLKQGVSPKWTNDSQRLILEHFDGISDSPSYIYRYALPFSPSSSWLHGYYTAELLQTVKVVKGLPAERGACHRTVYLAGNPRALACWENIVAVGLESGSIVILDAVTGNKRSVLSGHTRCVESLALSSDGRLLVSGGWENTINLWDTQTGGVIKTFQGHTDTVLSVSISLDKTTIVSGSRDYTIRLWDVRKGVCRRVIGKHSDAITCVAFSPADPRRLISASDGTVRQWDSGGRQIRPTYNGHCISFSSDGTRFVTWTGEIATVRSSSSGAVVAELQLAGDRFNSCCLSPDGRSMARTAGRTIDVWDLTGSTPRLVETFVGHAQYIASLAFSSSIISASSDYSVKFWQVGALLTNPTENHPDSTSLAPASIRSLTLQAQDRVAISSDSVGVVRTWDIETGFSKEFQTPVQDHYCRDVRLVKSRLIIVWCEKLEPGLGWGIFIWDVGRNALIRTIDTSSGNRLVDLKISADGSKVFFQHGKSLRAWSIRTGRPIGRVRLGHASSLESLSVDGSRVWAQSESEGPGTPVQGWDFGLPGIPRMMSSPHGHNLRLVGGTKRWSIDQSRIQDTLTGKEVFRLPERYANPVQAQWDGRYLVAGYKSGDVLILDFNHMFSR